ncbi:hypothetical protein, unlikely [Trypanosoma brucei gambiense DAL972]|uniref:Uncharacterized protein n=1 Tax=Trypanosoma brucei gambiense (strain MHOM/CI/86/DAL972) TaxID=679716 RepID=C9ZVL2_TRYB9|nr:hypothetical protein, unlikely [Trypanosoma brucei gambiense DAL972]CBH13450.1 hypothetical protein, unlikely [Trypanosoma brucei gambiense DAL972]|eukprot:XP_011775727.1 hypothetical protein, unlikely [Trypanosoma brucei gambiense DAL972]
MKKGKDSEREREVKRRIGKMLGTPFRHTQKQNKSKKGQSSRKRNEKQNILKKNTTLLDLPYRIPFLLTFFKIYFRFIFLYFIPPPLLPSLFSHVSNNKTEVAGDLKNCTCSKPKSEDPVKSEPKN